MSLMNTDNENIRRRARQPKMGEDLVSMAIKANEAGMSYGQYVAKLYCEENSIIKNI